MSSMTARERFHAVMSFQPFDSLPIIEWATWWDQTIHRWHGEGLPPRIIDRYDLYRHFEMDVYKQTWFPVIHWDCPGPQHHGAGILQTEADYERLRPYFYRILDDWPVNRREWKEWAVEQKQGDSVLWFTMDGFFWFARSLMGIERHLYAFYDQPELIHRINNDLVEWMLRVVDRVCDICIPDFMTFGEDMSYNNGPMLSKKQFDTFMLPYYRRIVPKLKERGILTIVDSDGDITKPATWFAEAGIEGMLPLERQAGVDVAAIRAKHPAMRFIGCFDKMTMNRGEAAMRAEFERLLPTARQGGFLISVDHQTPPGVSYPDYLVFLRLFREYAQLAAQ